MTRWWTRAGFALALGLSLVALPQAPADDEKKEEKTEEKKDEKEAKPTSSSAAKGPDWSGYVRVSQVTAEVVKADDSSVTLRLYMLASNTKGGARPPRPQLHMSHGHIYQNPLRRPSGRQPQLHWEHHDYTVSYAPEGLARTQSLPTKTDENGKKVIYTQKEIADLKAPLGAPGYALAKSDLAPGSIVDVIIIRDKTIAADKVTEGDLRIKYATVTGTVPTPPKDDANKKKN
jgi:hypothetical protein